MVVGYGWYPKNYIVTQNVQITSLIANTGSVFEA